MFGESSDDMNVRRMDAANRGENLRSVSVRCVVTVVLGFLSACGKRDDQPASVAPTVSNAAPGVAASTNEVPGLEAFHSVVITHDLDLGLPVPSAQAAMKLIDRRSVPDDGVGRTFAILEAFGAEAQPNGKLRLSLRVSMEKPGLGEIINHRTGEVIWKSRITPATRPPAFPGTSLLIQFEDDNGTSYTVDGSNNPRSILEAMLKEAGKPVSEFWPDGAVREMTFHYSACGCPVKIFCRRTGGRTVPTITDFAIFPDDPAVLQVISTLMKWP